jgi:Astacin (Peptidase family M12A)
MTCMKFVERTDQVGYVTIKNNVANECSATVGFTGTEQYLNLASGCMYIVNTIYV